MKPLRKVSRRSFIATVTGGVAGFGSFGAVARAAGAVQQTDADRYISDQPGAGRGPVSGITDKDSGDQVGNGRGDMARAGNLTPPERPPRSPFEDNQTTRHAESGVTDSDPTDPVGDGRAQPQGPPQVSPYDDHQQQSRHAESGYTDNDPTDPVGDGRNRPSCTDQDSGPTADRSGRGRRC